MENKIINNTKCLQIFSKFKSFAFDLYNNETFKKRGKIISNNKQLLKKNSRLKKIKNIIINIYFYIYTKNLLRIGFEPTYDNE